MTEEEARGWIAARYPAAMDRLARLAALVEEENARQNLVAPSTLPAIWVRHVADSVQLAPLAEGRRGPWVDVGTGGGFPGLAVAAVRDGPMILVEPRRRRAEFLHQAVTALGLAEVQVRQEKVERVRASAAVISARAVASVEALLHVAGHLSDRTTLWLLPRGQVTGEDEARLSRRKRMFHVEQSVTAADSHILVIEGVGP